MTYFIPKVVLEDRNDGCCQDRMENVEVRIGFENYLLDRNALNPLCFFQDFPPPNITSVFKCTSGTLEGRFVLARKVGVTTSENNYAWTVREVRVWVTEWS